VPRSRSDDAGHAANGHTSTPPDDSASDRGGANSVFKAVARLGLKLERRQEPVETIVVDRVSKTPLEN
jgi:uncharacterized protein (TIGR03435 family)